MTRQYTSEWHHLPRLRPNSELDFFSEETGDTFLCWANFYSFLEMILGGNEADTLQAILLEQDEEITLDISVRPLSRQEETEYKDNHEPYIATNGIAIRLYKRPDHPDVDMVPHEFMTMSALQNWIGNNLGLDVYDVCRDRRFQPYELHLTWGRASL